MYSKKVLEHFSNPRNMGKMDDYDAVGKVGNPICGDVMHIYIKVKDDRIEDIKFQTMGCAAAIATSSMVTEMAKGKTLEEAMELTRDDVAGELEGLPPVKMHCSNLAADGLHRAIENYRSGRKEGESEDEVKRMLVEELDITRETAGILWKAGMTSMEEVLHLSPQELKRIPGLSDDEIEKILPHLEEHNH
jgi:nitrogen fixation NifU-like protein